MRELINHSAEHDFPVYLAHNPTFPGSRQWRSWGITGLCWT